MNQISHPLLASIDRSRLDNYLSNYSHCTLLLGSSGSNCNQVAIWLATNLSQKADGQQKNSLIMLDGKKIGIDELREAKKLTRSAEHSRNTPYRVICITNLDGLSIEAQNSLLKNIEEPNSGVVYVLASRSKDLIVNTIESRSNVISLIDPGVDDYINYFKSNSKQELISAYTAANGNYDKVQELLSGDDQKLNLAKLIVASSIEERLKQISNLSSSREDCVDMLTYLQSIYHYLLSQTDDYNESLIEKLNSTLNTQAAIEKNANIKLQLTKLFISI